MEREEMIEGMIRDYYPEEVASSESIRYAIQHGGYANIVRLFDLNYRKIPDGAVVLTKEEYEELKNLDVSYDALEDQYLNLMKKAGEIRKETAREIFGKAEKKKYIDNDDEGCYWGAVSLEDLADICGVEVEE